MKKIISYVMVLTIILCCGTMGGAVSASEMTDTGDYVYSYGDVSIIFDADTSLDSETRQAIADRLAKSGNAADVTGGEEASTYSWCWLTGHDKQTETAFRVTHKVSATSPRCLSETYSVVTCTKCDYYTEELIYSSYIECCAED